MECCISFGSLVSLISAIYLLYKYDIYANGKQVSIILGQFLLILLQTVQFNGETQTANTLNGTLASPIHSTLF